MRVVYLGTGEIGLPTLRWLADSTEHEVAAVITQPDKPVGRSQELTPPQIKVEALRRSIPVFQPGKIRDPKQVEELRGLDADLYIVMAYGQILPKSVLELPRIACLNLHASILPRYRGAAPIQAAILAGDRETGITIMYMDEGLDTGDLLSIRTIPIRRRETGGTLHDRLAELGPAALGDALELLKKEVAPRIPQDAAHATYAGKLAREHGKLDWNESAEKIERKIRAMNPWPGAFTVLPGGKKLKVYSAIVFRKVSGNAGEVLRADERGLLVGASAGAVLLKEVQMEGKKRMAAGEFLRGVGIAVGVRL